LCTVSGLAAGLHLANKALGAARDVFVSHFLGIWKG
jgi:hypothetical protein